MQTAEAITNAQTRVEQVWTQLLRPDNADFSREMAEYILTLKFSPKEQERMNQLAAKGRKAALTAEEDQELDAYIQVGHVLALLQSKARMSLKNRGSNE